MVHVQMSWKDLESPTNFLSNSDYIFDSGLDLGCKPLPTPSTYFPPITKDLSEHNFGLGEYAGKHVLPVC
jgi:hypothetical protein